MTDKFEYEYEAFSVKEKEEIKSIQQQYLPKSEKERKLERLRQLNHKVENTPTMISLSLGIAAILLFGLGMTFFLEWKSLWYCGIPFALIGIVGMVGNVFLHTKLIVYYKEKYKQEIIELANELLKE